jgi:hypothetical protein
MEPFSNLSQAAKPSGASGGDMAGLLLWIMATSGGVTRMKKKPQSRKPAAKKFGMIDFNFGDTSYQIDPSRRKVYHRWVEVETAKTFLIMGAWTQTQAQAKKAV